MSIGGATLNPFAAKALAKKDEVAALNLAHEALRDLRLSLDDDDARVVAAAAFVVRLDAIDASPL